MSHDCIIPNFWAPQSRGRITRVIKIERHLFLGKCIVTLSPTAHIKLDAIVHAKSHHFSLLSSCLLLFIHCSLHHSTFHCTMTSKTDQTSNVASDVAASGSSNTADAEHEATFASSSSNMVIQTMVKKEVPKLYEYWKAPTTTKKDFSAYYATDWLSGVMICSTTSLNFATIDRTNIVCFESHLMCGLGLPPIKFLVSILNYLRCKLVHLNPNAIATLSYFSMLCKCWLDIPPNTSLFWYFYYPCTW
jgi:hypothetical protein